MTTLPEKPILFSGPMVQAIPREHNPKTMTRRVMKVQPLPPVASFQCVAKEIKSGRSVFEMKDIAGRSIYGMPAGEGQVTPHAISPYAVGQHLWVRETYTLVGTVDPGWTLYRANGYEAECRRHGFHNPPPESEIRWHPSIFMPRALSHITLLVTGIKAERLQDISEEDAKAEGLTCASKDGKLCKYGIPDRDGLPGNDDYGWHWQEWEKDPRKAFRKLWDSINNERPGYSWAANPWVWAYSFEKVQAAPEPAPDYEDRDPYDEKAG